MLSKFRQELHQNLNFISQSKIFRL